MIAQVPLRALTVTVELDGDYYGESYWQRIADRKYEPDTIGFIEDWCNADVDFMDIGTANGAMTLIAASRGARVSAYEPDPRIHSVVARNIELNPDLALQITLHKKAISPESGSSAVRKEIGKRFNIPHSFRLIRWSKKLGIKTQACFVIGMPSEGLLDRYKSLLLIRMYTILGIGEIAIFIISPMPGSELYKRFEVDLSRISFSPTWRSDYKILSFVRLYWYANFLLLKLIFHPVEFCKSVIRFFKKSFELKMELAPFRSFQWKRWAREEKLS